MNTFTIVGCEISVARRACRRVCAPRTFSFASPSRLGCERGGFNPMRTKIRLRPGRPVLRCGLDNPVLTMGARTRDRAEALPGAGQTACRGEGRSMSAYRYQ